MPPRKKANASSTSRKSLPSSLTQPTKFGIQHFFERHTQNSKNVAVSSTPQNPKPTIHLNHGNPKQSPNSSLLDTPSDSLIPIYQISPEISKSLPLKRFNFSPGMLINQSQDDGVDEVTWKISPVNEKLQARVLENSSNIRQCSLNKASASNSAGNVEKWLCSPYLDPTETSSVLANRTGLKRTYPDQDALLYGSATNSNTQSSQRSPFRTPPSLSYSHDKLANGIPCCGATDQLWLKHHKKALLELLDQVEDVISVEDSVSGDFKVHSSNFDDRKGDKMLVKADHVVKRVALDQPEKVNGIPSNIHFLVLEVSEKHKPAESFGAKFLYKVLRLLNEQHGEEQVVYLWDECLVV